MYDSDLRIFQINILVPFLERMESKCACNCSWEVMMECWRMAARLASESSVTTRDRNTGLRSGHKGACKITNMFSSNQCKEKKKSYFSILFISHALLFHEGYWFVG